MVATRWRAQPLKSCLKLLLAWLLQLQVVVVVGAQSHVRLRLAQPLRSVRCLLLLLRRPLIGCRLLSDWSLLSVVELTVCGRRLLELVVCTWLLLLGRDLSLAAGKATCVVVNTQRATRTKQVGCLCWCCQCLRFCRSRVCGSRVESEREKREKRERLMSERVEEVVRRVFCLVTQTMNANTSSWQQQQHTQATSFDFCCCCCLCSHCECV